MNRYGCNTKVYCLLLNNLLLSDLRVADAADHVTIYNAILTLNTMTCIRFVPWDGKAKDFLLIWPIKNPQG